MKNKKEIDKMENQIKIEVKENKETACEIEKVSTKNCESTME